ncbi:MAG: amino acid ABC transporter ATP-binding protein [Bacteroidales bacterium]
MIHIENLQQSFGTLKVLRNINTTIHRGEVISIIGPSGTGKSTFLRCINLLDKPVGGKIIIDGVDILEKGVNVPKLRQKMGMVFQSFNLFEHLTILENITLAQIKILKKSSEEAELKAIELLKMVGLANKVDNYPHQLSGGQKQRVAIARCLAMEPEIILFDEPTSALDPTMVSEVLGVIKKLANEGMTMLLVTHEMQFARDVSTRIFYMDEGIIYEDGTAEQIFESPQKEKTRIFIRGIRNLKYRIENENYDLYDLNTKIEQFSSRYYLSNKIQNRLLLLVEELLQIIPLDKTVADISIEFSDKTREVFIIISVDKSIGTILETNDDDKLISLSIIKGYTKTYNEQITDNQLTLNISLKQSE